MSKQQRRPRKVLVAGFVADELKARTLRVGASRVWSLSRCVAIALEEFCARRERKPRRRAA